MSEQLSPNSKPRFQWIDQAKGIAILTILVFHFFQNYPDATPLIKTLTDKIAAKLGFAAVDIFFIIAGFNIGYSLLKPAAVSLSHLDWLSWLKKRLIRLYPGYFLAIFFTLVLSFLGGQFKIKSGFNFILSLLGIAGYQFQAINPGFWFFTVILESASQFCKTHFEN
ncbi:hypothetical protein BST81_25470 [Leptolyngbya sp. 'hensonii']|uniref:acyltransferase family protein n=1 Tax=Leptolyngbya sp. 'hensonii' TaxID=1922337 RepID=UPI00094FB984|nr:acyltransferase family protein [Leptolyngbya sp. 'hensonii']OLP15563.1 hypothetical protein BST81_25470 [Leptolyngbya sp. 'hensonii']